MKANQFTIDLESPKLRAGDIAFNCSQILSTLKNTKEAKEQITVFSENTLIGSIAESYYYNDLQLRKLYKKSIKAICRASKGRVVVFGGLDTVYIADDGKLVDDIQRFGTKITVIAGCELLGSTIEDAEIVICPMTLPFSISTITDFHSYFKKLSQKKRCLIVSVNSNLADNGLVYGGEAFIYHKGRKKESKSITVQDTTKGIKVIPGAIVPEILNDSEIYFKHITFAIKEQLRSSGCSKVIVGVSGGIDSALVATLATFALGPQKVIALYMPSRFSSQLSNQLSMKIVNNLKLDYTKIDIEGLSKQFKSLYFEQFNRPKSIVNQNSQARIRAMILMSYANQYNYLLLATGNKSEIAMGYTTLYGDSCGGLAPIGDLTKTNVYKLANWINRNGEIIPQGIINRPPSAELTKGQLDSDTLPDYGLLDSILEVILCPEIDLNVISKKLKVSKKTIKWVWRRLVASEFKRRQTCPAVRVSETSFTFDWQCPKTKHFCQES